MTEAPLASSEPQSFLAGLVESVHRALPSAETSGALTIERERSLGDRLAGRAGTIASLRLEASGEALTLSYTPGPRWNAELARISGGVIISRRSLALGEWLTEFAGRIAAMAADEAQDAAAAGRALNALGIKLAATDILVSDDSVELDLSLLSSRLTGRMPTEAVDLVGRIAALLADTLPRVSGDAEFGSFETETLVRRTATIYLPDTLRAYLSLPTGWAVDHRFRDGTTPAQALVAQLGALEAAVTKLHESALEQDAAGLLNNGRFLAARFATSGLELD
ncbi:MAG TPA: hypothetical protein VGI56_11420 [Galbitalea sp.]|jgi:hypothetical protein